jgi:hypothetical protein
VLAVTLKRPLPAHLSSQAHVQQRSQWAMMAFGLCYDGDALFLEWSGRAALLLSVKLSSCIFIIHPL